MRRVLRFEQINRRGTPGYAPDLQRHHLLPRQLLTQHWFAPMLGAIGRTRIGFDDFRRNGLLLPARESAVRRLALPLHRGPHRLYNEVVLERVGQIESCWSCGPCRRTGKARENALFRLALLQRTLRRSLLERRIAAARLNRRDPLAHALDFAELDAMAERLWADTQPPVRARRSASAV